VIAEHRSGAASWGREHRSAGYRRQMAARVEFSSGLRAAALVKPGSGAPTIAVSFTAPAHGNGRLHHKGRVTSLLCPAQGSRHVRIASAAPHMGAGAPRISGFPAAYAHSLRRRPCATRIMESGFSLKKEPALAWVKRYPSAHRPSPPDTWQSPASTARTAW
jgi:hypothetical protein